MVKRSNFRSAHSLCLVLILLLSAPAFAGNLTMTFDAAAHRIVDGQDGQQLVEMDGFNYMLTPGKPMLPAKSFMIALPPGARVNSVDFIPGGVQELDGTYRIQPAAGYMPMTYDPVMVERAQREWRMNNNAVYMSDQPYPQTVGVLASEGGLRKYSYITVIYTPFSYQPQSGRLTLSSSVTVSIDYTDASIDDPRAQRILRDTKADRQAAELFVNFQEARDWYTPDFAPSDAQVNYDVLIIHANGLDEEISTLASDLFAGGPMASWVATPMHVIDTGSTGDDLAEKIRNYLIAKYSEWGIDYLLLVGDVSVIPMRMCFPEPSYHYPGSDYCPPTDYYYADLTGDWDSDNDGYYGEYGQDNVDFTPELHVGRIPYRDSINVTNIMTKLTDFQYDQGSWKDNALLLGAVSNYENEDYSGYDKTDGADLMEDMITGMLSGFTYTREYEEAGIDPCPYTSDYPLSHTNAITQWANNDFGIVNWWAHGSQYSSSRKWWSTDDGDGVPESTEIPWEVFVSKTDATMLDNDHSSIVFSCSCNNGWPEVDNLAQNLLKRGSAGIVAATRVSWYAVGWTGPSWGGNASIDYYFFNYMINNSQRLGQALSNSRIYYANNFLYWWGWPSAQNLYDFCLFGSPFTLREGESVSCCVIRGDVDHSGQYDAMDIVFFVDWLWNSGPPPPCLEEADVDGSGQVDPMDLTYLVDNMWNFGAAPVPCP